MCFWFVQANKEFGVRGKKVLNDDSIIHCAMNIQRRMQEAHLQVDPHPKSLWLHCSRPSDCPACTKRSEVFCGHSSILWTLLHTVSSSSIDAILIL